MELTTPDVDEILELPFLSYHKPLDIARSLGRTPEGRGRSIALLERLVGRYPDALAPGQELVLALMEEGRHDEAEARLKRFEKEFLNLDEESLCRWGRLFKDRGDSHCDLPWSGAGGRHQDADLAAKYYRSSLEKYDLAYRIRSGHYPGINKATLLLNLAPLGPGGPASRGSAELMQESAESAETLLAGRADWPREQPDDEAIWHPATAGEAHLLLREWGRAEGQYREALRHKGLTPQRRNSMRRQAERIAACFRKLGVSPAAPFDDPASFFAPSPEQPAQARVDPQAPTLG